MSRLEEIASRLATIQLCRTENGSSDRWSIEGDAAYLLTRVRALEAGLTLLADEDNWDYGDYGRFWSHRDAQGQGTDAQEIARAALAGEA